MYERLTDRARKVMQLANQEAQRFNHDHIGTEHILLGLVKEGNAVAAKILETFQVPLNLREFRAIVELELVGSQRDISHSDIAKLPHTPRAKKVIEYAVEEARELNHNFVGTEHLLLGLMREQEGLACKVLIGFGLVLERVREEAIRKLGHKTEDQGTNGPMPAATSGDAFLMVKDGFGTTNEAMYVWSKEVATQHAYTVTASGDHYTVSLGTFPTLGDFEVAGKKFMAANPNCLAVTVSYKIERKEIAE